MASSPEFSHFSALAPDMRAVRRFAVGQDHVMSALHLMHGAAAEMLVAAYLQLRGLEVLDRNLRCRVGELDLVCREGLTLVIVEVRQRRNGAFGGAMASVTRHKQRKIIRAAQFFWQRRPEWRRCALRFDVVAVTGAPDGSHQIDWVRGAFRAT